MNFYLRAGKKSLVTSKPVAFRICPKQKPIKRCLRAIPQKKGEKVNFWEIRIQAWEVLVSWLQVWQNVADETGQESDITLCLTSAAQWAVSNEEARENLDKKYIEL